MRRARWGAVALGVVVAVAAAGAIGRNDSNAPSAMGSPTGDAPIVGEHSAAGDRGVDSLNQAIAAMQRLRGEHAGLSRAENEAGEH